MNATGLLIQASELTIQASQLVVEARECRHRAESLRKGTAGYQEIDLINRRGDCCSKQAQQLLYQARELLCLAQQENRQLAAGKRAFTPRYDTDYDRELL